MTSSRSLKGGYTTWEDSHLRAKINDADVPNLNTIWTKAQSALVYATPPGWVSHGSDHILRVLRNLDNLIPEPVLDVITPEEAFALVASVLLHDIGMVQPHSDHADVQALFRLRQKHGERAAEMIRGEYGDLLRRALEPVCEIVRSHHGNYFNPNDIVGLRYQVRPAALWVRLADELDFGPERAPLWLLDYVRPESEQLEHWRKHNELKEPAIDVGLLRIQVAGTISDPSFVRKLRHEFEAPERRDLQLSFLGRGRMRPRFPTFIIWDCTEVQIATGEESRDTRAPVFSSEQFLLAARHLYNIGRYESARECFEEGKRRYGGAWSEPAVVGYFYHYLKTLMGLGEYGVALDRASVIEAGDVVDEVRADIAAARGVAHWKLRHIEQAKLCFDLAATIYQTLSRDAPKHRVNEADARTLCAAALLEQIRIDGRPWSEECAALRETAERELSAADRLFRSYEESLRSGRETHYRGRYFGVRAFLCLLDNEAGARYQVDDWDQASEFAKRARGGRHGTDRNPFGVLCGLYCGAAVEYHKYLHCEDTCVRQGALADAARDVENVRREYDNLFGRRKVRHLWDKINTLLSKIHTALEEGSEARKSLSELLGSEAADSAEIFTPLH